MAIETRSDFNIRSELAVDLAAVPSGAKSIGLGARTPQQQTEIDDALRRLNDFETSLANLPDDIKADALRQIDSARGMLNAGNIPLGGVGNIMADLRTSVDKATSNSNNSTAARDEAILAIPPARAAYYSSIGLGAHEQKIVESQIAAANKDYATFAKTMDMGPPPLELPPEYGDAAKAAKDQQSELPHVKKLYSDFQSMPDDEKAKVLADRMKRYKDFTEMEKDAPPALARKLRNLNDLDLFEYPEFERVADLYRSKDYKGAEAALDAVERIAANHAANAIMKREDNPAIAVRDNFLGTLSKEEREAAKASPEEFGRFLAESNNGIDRAVAQQQVYAAQQGKGELSPKMKKYLAGLAVYEATGEERRLEVMQNARTEMVRIYEKSQQQGVELTLEESIELENMQRMTSDKFTVREQAMATASLARRAEKQGGDTAEYTVGMATLTFAYAKTHGGIANHDKMMQAPANDAAAAKYREDFKAWQAKQMGFENLNEASALYTNERYMAMEALGRAVMDGKVDPTMDMHGNMVFVDRATYETRQVFVESSSQLYSMALDENSMMRFVMRSAEKQAKDGTQADKDFAALMRNMDTYRLQYDEKWQPLVRELYLSAGNDTAYAAARQAFMAQEGAIRSEFAQIDSRYNDFSGAVIANADQHQLKALSELGLIGPSGVLDVEGLMAKVESNKGKMGGMYRDYLRVPTSELRARGDEVLVPADGDKPQVTARDLAQARMLTAVTNQLRGMDALERIMERADSIEEKYYALKNAGQPIPQVLENEHHLLHVLEEYKPGSSPQQQEELVNAVRELMKRDPYIAEKEEADRYFSSPEDKAGIVDAVVKIYSQRFSQQAAAIEQPVAVSALAGLTSEELSIAMPPLNVDELKILPSALEVINENEGAGFFDKLETDKFETAIHEAVKGLNAESRRIMFGESEVLNRADVNKGATGEQAIYSVNEIETALKRLKLNDVSKIADVNGNGFDAEDIRAALVPNLAQNAQGQGKT